VRTHYQDSRAAEPFGVAKAVRDDRQVRMGKWRRFGVEGEPVIEM
jgi:hypothetical protein